MPGVDFHLLRQQISMADVLRLWGVIRRASRATPCVAPVRSTDRRARGAGRSR